jgi:hypothetical protein
MPLPFFSLWPFPEKIIFSLLNYRLFPKTGKKHNIGSHHNSQKYNNKECMLGEKKRTLTAQPNSLKGTN